MNVVRAQRALAAGVAVLAVGAGLAVRYGDDGGGGGAEGTRRAEDYVTVQEDFDPNETSTWFFDAGNEPQVRCAAELAAVCESIGTYWGMRVTVEPLWDTAEALRTGDLDAASVDAWLTIAPFDGLIVPDAPAPGADVDAEAAPGAEAEVEAEDAAAGAAEPFLEPVDLPVARTAIAALGAPERMAALDGSCGASPVLACAFERSGDAWSELGGDAGWGTVRPILPDPELTGAGVLALASVVEDATGGRALDPTGLASPEVAAALDRVAAAGPRLTLDPAEDMTRLGTAGGDVTVGLEAGGVARVEYLQGEDEDVPSTPLVPGYPTRLVTADVRLLVSGEYAYADQLRLVMEESYVAWDFEEAGWVTPSEGFPYLADAAPVWEDRPSMPPTSQAPDLATLVALRDRWLALRQATPTSGPGPVPAAGGQGG